MLTSKGNLIQHTDQLLIPIPNVLSFEPLGGLERVELFFVPRVAKEQLLIFQLSDFMSKLHFEEYAEISTRPAVSKDTPFTPFVFLSIS